MKEWLWTIKKREWKGHLTLWEFHIWRLYKKFVEPKLKIPKIEKHGKSN